MQLLLHVNSLNSEIRAGREALHEVVDRLDLGGARCAEQHAGPLFQPQISYASFLGLVSHIYISC